jgi:hypothetical protein
MAKSIMQTEKECYICRELYGVQNTYTLEEHHCTHGTANRQMAEKYGLKVHLCWCHHRSSQGVHHNRQLDLFLIQTAQSCFEEQVGSREEFMRIFGKNWL